MCLLCIEIAKGKMTAREAFNAFMEMDVPEDHVKELVDKMADIEPVPEEDDDDEGPQ